MLTVPLLCVCVCVKKTSEFRIPMVILVANKYCKETTSDTKIKSNSNGTMCIDVP